MSSSSSSMMKPPPLSSSSSSSSLASPPPLKITVEQAIDRLGLGAFQDKVTMAAGLTTASDAVEVLLLSFLSIVVQQEFGVTAKAGSLMTSIVFIGALFGTMILGPAGDKIGRKPVFMTSSIIISIAGLTTALANTYHVMLIFRFFVGFGLGGIVVAYDSLGEFLPQEHRGRRLLFVGYFWTIGTLLTPLIAYFALQEQESWRLFVLLCSFPCILSTAFAWMWVPESPRWLISHGKSDKAIQILRNAAQTNGKDPMAVFPNGTVFLDDPSEEHELHSLSCLFKKEWRITTLTVWGLWCGKAFMYWGTIQIVTLVFSDTNGQDLPDDQTYTFDYGAIFSSSAAEIVGQTIAILVVERIGRVLPMSILYLLGGISVVALCTLAELGTASRTVMIVLAFLARMFVMGAGGLVWLATAEVFPTQVRSTGHASASAIARIAGASTPWLVSSDNSFKTIAIAMGVFSFYTSSISCFLPETAGRAMGTANTNLSTDAKGRPQVSELL